MIDWSSCTAVGRDPERVSGALEFRGTRVLVSAPFQNPEDGAKLADLVKWFPGGTLDHARRVREHASSSLAAAARLWST
jgi:uncharacterized protein (DUF433 family)